jgi:signal transduction histidine kinase
MTGMDEAGATTRDRPSVVGRTVIGWHLTFAVLMVVLGVVIVVGDDPGSRTPVSLAVVGALAVAYLVLGLPGSGDEHPWLGAGYLAVLVVAVAVLVGLEGGRASLLLFAAYPQIWFYTPSFKVGSVWAVLLSIASTGGLLVGEGTDPDTIRDVVVSMGSGLLVSLVLGLWVGRIIEQSEERAALIAELERTRAQLGAAQHAAGVVAERERVAGEIHDTLAQGFTSIVALAQAESARLRAEGQDVARLELIEGTARQNLSEARALVAAFAPVDLQGSDVDAAIARVAERFGAETGIEVVVESAWAGRAEVPTDQAVVLLRAVQEALSNVRRHAGAGRVVLRLHADPEPVVEVVDDGVGFDPGTATGFGLDGMRRRVEAAGGRLDVDSAPGRGTRLRVSLP